MEEEEVTGKKQRKTKKRRDESNQIKEQSQKITPKTLVQSLVANFVVAHMRRIFAARLSGKFSAQGMVSRSTFKHPRRFLVCTTSFATKFQSLFGFVYKPWTTD